MTKPKLCMDNYTHFDTPPIEIAIKKRKKEMGWIIEHQNHKTLFHPIKCHFSKIK